MNKNDRILLARLDERLVNCQKEIERTFKIIQEDMSEIKDNITRVRGCTSNLHDEVRANKLRIDEHLNNVSEATKRWRWWAQWGSQALAVGIALVAVIISVF